MSTPIPIRDPTAADPQAAAQPRSGGPVRASFGRWSVFGGWTFAVLAMALIVSADFAWRVRPQDATLSSSADLSVAIELLVYAVVGGFLVLRLVDLPRGGPPSVLITTAWLYVSAMALSIVLSPYRVLATIRAGQLIVAVLMATVVARATRRTDLHRFLHTYVAIAVAVVPLGLAIRFPASVRAEQGRFRWLYVHPVIAANYLGIAVVIAVAYLFASRSAAPILIWRRPAYWVATVAAGGALLATQTRGALIATIAACVVVAVASRPHRWVDALLIGVAGTTAVLIAGSQQLMSILLRDEGLEQLETLNSRTEVWAQASELVAQSPWLGHGFMAARGLFLDRFGLGGAHNAVFEVLVNGGILGFSAWLAMLVAAVVAVLRVASTASPATRIDVSLAGGLLTFLYVNAMSTGQIAQAANAQSIVLFVVIGWMAASRRWRREEAT